MCKNQKKVNDVHLENELLKGIQDAEQQEQGGGHIKEKEQEDEKITEQVKASTDVWEKQADQGTENMVAKDKNSQEKHNQGNEAVQLPGIRITIPLQVDHNDIEALNRQETNSEADNIPGKDMATVNKGKKGKNKKK